MKRTLLFARDPGGANTIIPLVKPLRERGFEVLVYGKDVALEKYRQAACGGTDIMTVLPEISLDAVRHFIESEAPEVIITGTSADDFTEKFIWKAAADLGIPSIAILDQWMNYGLRFSGHGVNDISEYLRDRVHPYLPTRIAAIDEYARSEMIAQGLPAERIVICGQPYFEVIQAGKDDSSETVRFCPESEIRQDDFVVVFASEPITATYGTEALDFWGYTEQTILSALMRGLEKVAGAAKKRLVLVIRPHPKEGHEHFADIVAQSRSYKCLLDTETAAWPLMKRADLVCGMSSIFLIESVILQRPTLSLQIGLRREDPFVLSRRGILPSLLSEDLLTESLRRIILLGEYASPRIDIIPDPVQRILQEVEKLLCRNSQ